MVQASFSKNDESIFLKTVCKKNLTLSYVILSNGHLLVTAQAVDKNGLRCLDYEKKVYFQCLSGGETIKNQGTPTGSETISMANGKASIEVKPNKNGTQPKEGRKFFIF